MKSIIMYLGSALILAIVVMGQGNSGGCNCVQNMLDDFASLGCNSGDNACLCRNPNFTYGIRDCSNESCGTAAQQAISDGYNLCLEAGVAIAVTPEATVTQPTGTATVTAAPIVSSIFTVITSDGTTVTSLLGQTTIVPGGENETAPPSAVSTSTFTTIITSGESTITSVGETTILGVGGVPGATSLPQTPVTTEPIVSTITSGESIITSTVGSTTILSSLTGVEASSALSSEASETASPTETQQETQTETGEASSASSTGLAPKQTFGPAAGIMAAAGLAAMLI